MKSITLIRRLHTESADTIIKKFTTPTTTKQKTKRKPSRVSQSIVNLYGNLNSDISQYLPVTNDSGFSPFQFHSTYNNDKSYITSPRLLVTKMLVDQWCQLREFYRIFANSPRVPPTRLMKLGTDEHTRLELRSHPTVLVEPPTLTMDPIDVPYLYEAYAKESEIAENISESILYRLYNLFVTSEAREIRVHGYVNLQSLELESFRQTSDSTLINGIIDLIELKDKHNPETDFSMIQDIEQYLPTFNIPIMETYTEDRDQQQGIIVPDSETSDKFTLTTFLDQLTQLLPYYSDSMELIIGDIKTRSVQSIPRQQSVIESAKFQVFYYHQFLTILATSGNSYRSLVDSWQLRNVDLDVPINYKTMFMLLKKYGPLLFDDMIKLSKGVPLGMDQFDEFIINNPTTKSTVVYDPSECFAEHKSSHPLLRPWVNPPTLRYLLARCSQMYQVLGPFISPKCKVEYRNGHTHKVIATNEYEFDSNELKAQIHKASSFWNGSQNPKVNQDISKCKYCEFKAHCPVPHHQVHNDTGDGIQPSPKKLGDLVYHEFLHVQM